MDRYIGLDAHASSCTLAVVGPSGQRLGSYVVETNARALTEVLRGIPGSRRLCMEEGAHGSSHRRDRYSVRSEDLDQRATGGMLNWP